MKKRQTADSCFARNMKRQAHTVFMQDIYFKRGYQIGRTKKPEEEKKTANETEAEGDKRNEMKNEGRKRGTQQKWDVGHRGREVL